MDPTFCPHGYYTDRAFQRVPVDECGTEIVTYWVLTSILLLLRIAATFKKFLKYINGDSDTNGAFPVGLVSHFFATIFYAFIIFFIGFNIANVDNGGSFSFYSLAYLTFIVNYSTLLLKIVRLGKRLIPNTRENPIVIVGELNFLTKFTSIGLAFLLLQTVAAFISSVVLIILSPIFPSNILLGELGFGMKGVFQMLCILGICFQFQRCIVALTTFSKQEQGKNNQLVGKAISVMRKRQLTIFVMGIGVSILFVLFAAQVVPWTWHWVILGTAGPESLGVFLFEFFLKPKSHKGKTSEAALKSANPLPEPNLQQIENQEQQQQQRRTHSASSSEIQTFTPPKSTNTKGLLGRRFRRKHKHVVDLSKVSEEPSQLFDDRSPQNDVTINLTPIHE